jgi:putative cell wall-binding protein
LLLKESTGLYGFKGDPFFNALEEKIYTGSSANLRGGGAVVTTYHSKDGLQVPANKGSDITYTTLPMNGGTEVDITAPGQPTVNVVSDKDTSVTGLAEAGSKVEVKVSGTVIGSGTSGTDGKFTVTIPVQKAGTELVVTATDKAGNVSTVAKVAVKDVTAPGKPAVNEVSENDTSVTGQAEAGSKVEVKVSGAIIGSGTTGTDGKFTVTIPVQKSGTRLVVTASDLSGNVSESMTVTVKDANSPEAPKVGELTDRETILSGSAEPSTTIIAKVSGVEIGRGTADSNGKFTVAIPKQASGKVVEVYAMDNDGNVSPATKVTVKKKLVSLIGETRYATAVKVAQTGWDTAETVLLVNGFAIVDGLTATPLASAKNAPILLTAADSIPKTTIDEISRLKAKEIILIGGDLVITPKVENELAAKGYKVTRIGGSNRKDTSLRIAKELDKLVDVSTIYVAYGFGEPDALSIAAQAGLKKQPIILADKTSVPADTLTWLKSEELTDAYFIGGESVVGPSILNEIDKITSGNVLANRLSGVNRHETNAKVISKFYPEAELTSILLAKSETESLVDALAAGPLAAKLGSPVLLVSSPYGILASQKQALAGKNSKYVHQIGGGVNPSAVGELVK